MSKAFTRENDDAEETASFTKAALPEGARRLMTADGAERLRKELAALVERQRQREAADDAGDLREELRRTHARIGALSQTLAAAEVVTVPAEEATEVRFGMFVTVRESGETEEEYRIVGVDEVDLEAGWMSWLSPLARALLGKKAGEIVRFRAPGGEKQLEVLRIRAQ